MTYACSHRPASPSSSRSASSSNPAILPRVSVFRPKVASTSRGPSFLPLGSMPAGPATTSGVLPPRAAISLAIHRPARISFLSGSSGVTTAADLSFVTSGNIPPCQDSCCGAGMISRAMFLSPDDCAALAAAQITIVNATAGSPRRQDLSLDA